MIDLHSHVLPGLDDGPRTLEESMAMARAAAEDGIRTLAATPHVRDDWPTTPAQMTAGVAAVRAELDAQGIELVVVPGGEIALERLGALRKDELRAFGLGGNPDYLLVEFPYRGWPLDLQQKIFDLRLQGIRPVIAHPERNAEVQANPARCGPLVEAGALMQVTAASLDGRLGRASRGAARRLLELELAHLLASDAHAPAIRGIGLSAAAEAVGDDALAEWLTVGVPGAIVTGAALPARPTAPKKRGLRLRFR